MVVVVVVLVEFVVLVMVSGCSRNSHGSSSFTLFSSLQHSLIQLRVKILPMAGFELQISGVGSYCSTNRVATTAPIKILFY